MSFKPGDRVVVVYGKNRAHLADNWKKVFPDLSSHEVIEVRESTDENDCDEIVTKSSSKQFLGLGRDYPDYYTVYLESVYNSKLFKLLNE